MLEQGLLKEVEDLYKEGYDSSLISMQGLGYKEILAYLKGECTLEEAVYVLKRDTRHFAKRQLTWFRHDPNIQWVDKDGKTDAQIQQELLKVITDTLPLTM